MFEVGGVGVAEGVSPQPRPCAVAAAPGVPWSWQVPSHLSALHLEVGVGQGQDGEEET